MPFNSSEMRKFAAEYGFTINTSSTEHARNVQRTERAHDRNGQTTYAKGK